MMLTRRAWWCAVVAAVVVSACSGDGASSDDLDGAATDAASDSTVADSTVDEPTASTSSTVSDPDLGGLAALEASPPELADPDAPHRCERMGYTCSWSDVDDAMFESVLELAAEVQDLASDPDDPVAAIEAALERLATEDVVELIVDREGYTGMLYRLEGTPELFATTALSAPVGDPVTVDLAVVDEVVAELAALPDATMGQPQGFARPERYHPTGGPQVGKSGLVLDPQATVAIECPGGEASGCFADPSGRTEGAAIYSMMSAHPQISATYHAGSEVAPWNLMNLGGYDLVHVATHGTSGCANDGPGWTTGVSIGGADVGDDARRGFVDAQRNTFASTPLDPNRCYSITVLGPFDQAAYRAWGQRVPPGFGFNGHAWGMMAGFFAGQFGPESIVYLSHCTSADGGLFSSGAVGSFVGWHSYARTTVAYDAGIEFWRLMVAEGVEFDLAIERLGSQGLDWTVTAGGSAQFDGFDSELSLGLAGAFLATTGRNQRARDVVTMTLDGSDVAGQTLRVNGLPNDNEAERFPADDQQLRIEIEGVKDGTAGAVTIQILADDVELDHTIELERDGISLDDGEGWSTWRIDVPDGAIELPDADAADFAPGATPVDLEVRVFESDAEYTADGGEVRLGARLASNGPLPIFEQLATELAGLGEVQGNDVEFIFDTEGGEAEGYMRVEMIASGLDVGYWELQISGNYDADGRRLTGVVTGEAFGTFAGLSVQDSGAGQFQGTVDLAAGTLTGTIGISGQSQPYNGRLRPAGAATG